MFGLVLLVAIALALLPIAAAGFAVVRASR